MIFKQAYLFLVDIIDKRFVVLELAKRDFQQQYQGSYLGFVWMFLQPLLFISILYLVFTFGFRSGESNDMPFALYLVTGMVCWLYLSSNLVAMTDVIINYSFLVKKIDFRLSVLPIVKLASSAVAHFVLVLLAVGLAWYKGFPPTLYSLQVVYYFLAMSALLLGLGWLTSSTTVFVSDVSKLVSVLVQFGFWLTPVFWNPVMIPGEYRWLVELNPAYYIISGYRDSLIAHVAFWDKPVLTVYYWSVSLLCMLAGIGVYRKLRPHFAEVV
jgi:lipopolysaccharide transport system permease protein